MVILMKEEFLMNPQKFSIGVLLFLILFSSTIAKADLITHVELNQTGPVFSYTVFNDEPLGSPNFVSIWHLDLNAPIAITNTPAGWDYFTDNATFVDWFSTDLALPYPHDIAPGSFLDGFVIESAFATSELHFYTVGSWDHVNDSGGPGFQDLIFAPAIGPTSSVVPEPSTMFLGILGTFVLGGYGWVRQFLARVSHIERVPVSIQVS
jgi:hypothetical protein